MTRAAGSWMTCLSGAVEETRYVVPAAEEDPELLTPRSPAKRPLAVPGVIASLAPCPPLRGGRTAQLLPGQTAYISDEIVRCAPPVACICLCLPLCHSASLLSPHIGARHCRHYTRWAAWKAAAAA